MTRTIEIENIGPIPRLTIPAEPGVVVVRGAQGAGKSIAQETVSCLMGAKVDLSCSDKAKRGTAEGLGVKLTVGKSRVTRSGELEVTGIEQKIDLATFIEPHLRDPEAADRARIKALVALSGVRADCSLFYGLAGGREAFDKIVRAGVRDCTDLLDMAKLVKADLEAEARRAESEADHESGHASACAESVEGLDLSLPSEAAVLDAQRDAAVTRLSELQTQASAADKAKHAAVEAEKQLAAMGPHGTTSEAAMLLDTARQHYREAQESVARANERVAELERQVVEAKNLRALVEQERDHAAAEVRNAEARKEQAAQYEQAVAGWQATIDAAKHVAAPTLDELSAAADAVAEARRACERGVRIRDGIIKLAQAEAHREKARLAKERAESLRKAAKETDDVLSGAISVPGLWIQDNRILTETRRGETYFAELSDGERTKIAIDLGIDRVGENGLLGLPQWLWQGFQPRVRKEVHEYAKAKGVTIIAAEVDDGELRAERFVE